MSYGFIYCLGNEYMPETYKIGMTERSPTQRSIELSGSTGVPSPFNLLCFGEVENPLAAEKELHEYFNDFRVNQSREFFNCDYRSISEAIEDICMSFVETEHGAHVRHFNNLHEYFNTATGQEKAESFIELASFSGLCLYMVENKVCMNGRLSPSNIIVRGAFQLMVPLLDKYLQARALLNLNPELKVIEVDA